MKFVVDNSPRPELAGGQVWKHKDGMLYFVAVWNKQFLLVDLETGYPYTGGRFDGFAKYPESFTYLGKMKLEP